MKNFITKATFVAFTLAMFVAFTSCSKEAAPIAAADTDSMEPLNDVEVTNVREEIGKLTEEQRAEIIENTINRGIDMDDVVEKMVDRPDGTTEKVYVIEGDIEMTPMQYREFLDNESRQYRTSNLVSNNQTITVIGYTGSGFALTSRMRTGLQWAINNYNRLNIGLSFSLSYAASTNADIVVYNNGQAGGGGSAGFPSNGNPYKWVQINAGTNSFSTNVNEHVITHEIGHCLGFRHTDYFNRSISCGSGGNEGSAGVGAIHIPGTGTTNSASGFDFNSIMLACFNSGVNGEFSSQDVTALEFLY